MRIVALPESPGIYLITNLITGLVYVGSSQDVSERVYRHRLHLSQGKHGNRRLQRSWNKHGSEAFDFTIIEICDDRTDATLLPLEQHYIDMLKSSDKQFGYNLAPVAGSTRGVKRSAEDSAAKSMRMKGKHRLTPMSEETKQKLSKAKLGIKRSPEACEKMRLAQLGRNKSEAQKESFRNAMLVKAGRGEHHANYIENPSPEQLRKRNTHHREDLVRRAREAGLPPPPRLHDWGPLTLTQLKRKADHLRKKEKKHEALQQSA